MPALQIGETKDMPLSTNYMGFDDYLYVVTVTEGDGEESEYEFGNSTHAKEIYNEFLNKGMKVTLKKYSNGKTYSV